MLVCVLVPCRLGTLTEGPFISSLHSQKTPKALLIKTQVPVRRELHTVCCRRSALLPRGQAAANRSPVMVAIAKVGYQLLVTASRQVLL